MRALLAMALLLALAAPAPAATVDADALRVEVDEDPFALRFVDARDGDVLRTLHADGLRFGFNLREQALNNAYFGYAFALEADVAWFRATRVLERREVARGLELRLATDDPLGHVLRLTVTRRGDGIAAIRSVVEGRFRPSVSGATFAAGPGDERFLGFGSRSNAADQTGQAVFSWAEEGPFSSGRGEPITRNIPDFTFPTGPTATNFPVPWLVSSRGFGVLVDQGHRSTFRLRRERDDAWSVEAWAGHLSLEVYAGPDPADVVRRYSGAVGRQPDLPPWGFGPWYQPTLEKEPLELARRFRAEDVPVSVAQTYTHYLPCGAHVGREQAERERVAAYHALGYKITTYFNPHICTTYQPVYDEAAARGLLVENAAGQPYLLSNPFTADQQISEIDFTHPEAQAFFGRLLDDALDAGYDGWMEDFGEYTPTDSVFHDGRVGYEMHNLYPVLYHRASTRHTTARRGRDFVAYIRSGFHGVQPYARAVWGGDPTEDWSCSDGLCAAVHQGISQGLTGIAYWGSDIGGFHAVVNGRTDDELNTRWLQAGFASGIMRTQANGYSVRNDRATRSQVWSPAVLPVWRRYAKLRTQLYPYLAGAAAQYRERGLPLMRHLALAFPDDPEAVRAQEEFLFGPDLLAAPVIRPGERERRLHVPAGRWIDLWRSVAWDDEAGTIRARRPRTIEGGGDRTLPAPLEELPLLARAGTLLPLLPSDVDTLADVGRADGVVKLDDRHARLRVLAFPHGRSAARFYSRGRLRSVLRRARWTLRIRSTRTRRYAIEAPLPFRARCARVGRRRVRVRTDDGVTRVRVRARRARLVVSRRC